MMAARPGRPLGGVPLELFAILVAYFAFGVLFLWVGVDSLRGKRWVRPVVVAVGWNVIAGSALLILFLCVAAGSAWAASPTLLPASAPVAAETPFDYLLAAAAVLVFGVALPGCFVWAYAPASTARMLAALDRREGPSWTEHCPPAVFVACAGLAGGGLVTSALSLVGSAPFFGGYVSGPAATALVLLAGAGLIAAAVLMYLGLRPGWSLALAVVALGFTSAIASLAHGGVMEFYRRGGARDYELAEAAASPVWNGPAPVVLAVMTGVTCVAYLGWVRTAVGPRAADEWV
jgi:hypothetical protein